MALDGAFLFAVKQELACLLDGRVEKVYQPARDTVILCFRTKAGPHKLLISAEPSSARVHLTQMSADNPKQPPMFCMLMRKHLSGGRLTALRQDGLERILFLDFACTNELGDAVQITLACEIMGRCSNLILMQENGRVIDSLRRVDAEMSRERLVLPGITYALPPRDDRLCFLTASAEELRTAFTTLQCDTLAKQLITKLEGISPVLAREWTYYATRGREHSGVLTDEELDRLLFAVMQAKDALISGHCCFSTLRTQEGVLKDFSFVRISQYGALMLSREYESACALLDAFYARRESDSRLKQRANDLFRLLVATSERITKRLANQREELLGCAGKEDDKRRGDLLSANLYALQKGDVSATVLDFYSDPPVEVEIPLDSRLTPAQNAQRYYGKYRKASTAEKKLAEQIAKGEEELIYIDSVFDALTRAGSEDEIAVLRQELHEQGYLHLTRQKGKPPKSLPPLQFVSADGFRILVGRNNKQNDQLTLKQAEKTDIWLHVQNMPGSHVIICAEGAQVPERTISEAAQLAAYFSKGSQSAQVPVDYCPVRAVKKPAGAKPGMVIFTGNRTLFVKPDESVVERCKAGDRHG